ncbi:WSC domain-containing protein [Podospora didyma]|uniref:WSC domain-containing protein n=1 Tax=Podospora didyma TaxID=330526 RepID=A0AAE0N4E2_9PEZI|nr:WSC domain-containing protein [Podospora didyma]
MTLEKCAAFCTAWPYFGTEYGRECYCGYAFTPGGSPVSLESCSFPCAGDNSQKCGAGGFLSLYMHPAKAPGNAAVVAGSSKFGCATDNRGGRALGAATTASDSMTLEMCAAFCSAWGFWGVEYGRECYCGNELNANAVLVADEECDMLCAGSNLEFCGAGDRLMVYQKQ